MSASQDEREFSRQLLENGSPIMMELIVGDVTGNAAYAAAGSLINDWKSHVLGGWTLEQLIENDAGRQGEKIAELLGEWFEELLDRLDNYRDNAKKEETNG